MQKEIGNRKFVQDEDFDFLVSLKNIGREDLLMFNDTCEEINNSLFLF